MALQTMTEGRRVATCLRAAEIYETAEVRDLWMGGADEGIHLFYGEVVENDGPGAGRSDDQEIVPFVEVAGQIVLRKTLYLEDPRTAGAQVAFIGRERKGHQATLRFTVNGQEVLRPPSPVATPEARQYWELARDEGAWSWSRWYYVEVPPASLRRGENEITLEAVEGRMGWDLMVADYRSFHKGMPDPVVLPRASSLSRDGGRSWEAERGEYVLRLVLKRFRRQGELVSPVFDVAGEGEVKGRRSVQGVSLDWDAETPPGTRVAFQVRTGSRPAHEPECWGGWRACEAGEPVEEVRGRYAQWRALFETEGPSQTPLLKAVRVEAQVAEEADPPLRVVRAENARILRPSCDFVYEDYGCGMLRELRERFELDAVVAGAQTEFERIERLMAWAYWIPLKRCSHFPWNVLDWLKLERDGQGAIRMNEYRQRRRDAMCLYPNVVLVAAYLSVGIPARHVNFHSEGMTGHEIAEVWSNDYRKWVHVDATRDYYWYDRATLTPLDTQEIHQVLIDRLERAERWDSPYLFRQDLKALVEDLPIAFREGNHKFPVEEGALFLFRSFCHFRMVPRYNVFSEPRPLPVSQGTEVWGWNGYLNWADDKAPPLAHFTHHTNRRADFYPTLNQTRFTLERDGDPETLRVHLETDMPNFAGYLASVDREAWEERPGRFAWRLHEGLNTLRVRSRNRAGVEGIVSAVTVEV